MVPGRPRIGSLVTVLVLWSWITVLVVREPPTNVLSWDTFGYYLYLPATLLHGDPALYDQGWVQEVFSTYRSSTTFYQAGQLPDGRWVMKYPMGLAVLWSPFFVMAHVIAGLTGHAPDGFSAPYQWAVVLASLLYGLIGLLVLRNVLGRFFPDGVTAMVIGLLVLGTNYLHQSLFGNGMPHVVLFTLYAGILWHTVRWHEAHRKRDAFLLALLMGLAILSRPSEAVCLFIPLLYGLKDAAHWKDHWSSLMRYRGHLFLVLVVLFLIGLPQFLYWKWLTGKFLYNSYNNPGEGFEFLHPYVWEVLFSFRKGWYIYTPLMAVATGGLFLLRRALPEWRVALVTFFLLNLYVIGSWSCWWYADSFGQRALVQSYAVMALPLGAVVHWFGRRRSSAFLGGGLLVLLTGFNLFQTYQSTRGLIHTSRMTWPAYQAGFGKVVKPASFNDLLLVDRSYTGDVGEPDLRGYRELPYMTIGFDAPFKGQGRTHRRDTLAFAGPGSFLLTADSAFAPAIRAPWITLTAKDHLWVRVSCAVHLPKRAGPQGTVCFVTTFEHEGYSYMYKAICADPAQARADGWTTVSYWYLTPEVRRPTDPLLVYAWLQDGSPTLVDEIQVTLYEPIQ